MWMTLGDFDVASSLGRKPFAKCFDFLSLAARLTDDVIPKIVLYAFLDDQQTPTCDVVLNHRADHNGNANASPNR